MKRCNAKERKHVAEQLDAQFGCDTTLIRRGDLYYHDGKKRYYLVEPDVAAATEGLRLDAFGCYVLAVLADGLRPSIEGSQLFGPSAQRHVLDLSDAQFSQWLLGDDVPEINMEAGIYLIRHDTDFAGTGKVLHDGTLKNYVAKTRRVSAAFP